MATTTHGIKLDDETRERLRALSKLKDRSPHWLMKAAIQEYIEREEAAERERLEDRARWERYMRTGAFVANDEMMSWLDALANEARSKSSGR